MDICLYGDKNSIFENSFSINTKNLEFSTTKVNFDLFIYFKVEKWDYRNILLQLLPLFILATERHYMLIKEFKKTLNNKEWLDFSWVFLSFFIFFFIFYFFLYIFFCFFPVNIFTFLFSLFFIFHRTTLSCPISESE